MFTIANYAINNSHVANGIFVGRNPRQKIIGNHFTTSLRKRERNLITLRTEDALLTTLIEKVMWVGNDFERFRIDVSIEAHTNDDVSTIPANT